MAIYTPTNYLKESKNVTKFQGLRGMTDWTNLSQFTQFMTGYYIFKVVSLPEYMLTLGEKRTDIDKLNKIFTAILEQDFRGLSGTGGWSTETSTISNGAKSISMITDVVEETNVNINLSYYERTGMPLTRYVTNYLKYLVDPNTKAKTYGGLIADNTMKMGFENEVFTFLYIVTDSTYLEVEKAFMFCNMQLTGIDTSSLYEGRRGEISNQEIPLQFSGIQVSGNKIDAAAKKYLNSITNVNVTYGPAGATMSEGDGSGEGIMTLDSDEFNYDILSKLK